MKHLSLLLLSVLSIRAAAQFTECGEIPISYSKSSVVFGKANMSFGDSMISVLLTNNHPTQGYAYPLAKLVPLNPLPTGMTLSNNNNPWSVFASSWNPGVTMPAYIFYNITAPIPDNYTVTFELWVSNLSPTITDSCRFDSTITINLKPLPLGWHAVNKDVEWGFSLSHDELVVQPGEGAKERGKVVLWGLHGQKIREIDITLGKKDKALDISGLSQGIYLLSYGDRTRKICIQ